MSINKEISNIIDRTRAHLLEYQKPEGSIYGNVYSSVFSASSYLLLIDYLKLEHPKKSKIVEWVINAQNDDGSWGDIAIKDYSEGNYRFTSIALEAVSDYISEDKKQKAKEWLENYANEKIIDPYSLLMISTKKDVELISPPSWILFIPETFSNFIGVLNMCFPKFFSWSVFVNPSVWTKICLPPIILINKLNKEKLSYIDKIVIKKCENELKKTQLDNGSWFELGRPTRSAVFAFRKLGYPLKCHTVQNALSFLNQRVKEDGAVISIVLSVWETSLSMLALFESGVQQENLKKSRQFLLNAQNSNGGWGFNPNMKNFPDSDDVALAILALSRYHDKEVQESIDRGISFLIKRQNIDGGWASFGHNQCKKVPGRLRSYDTDLTQELKDPSTADVTGHVLYALGKVGKINSSSKVIRKAIKFLKNDQLEFGGWWGRWGVCHTYGASEVLRGLKTVGENMRSDYVQSAIRWLKSFQNADGGWGEYYKSIYLPKPIRAKSTITQTSWVLLALMECGENINSYVIESGIEFLVKNLSMESKPFEITFSAIDFAVVETYPLIFTLWALSKYKKLKLKESDADGN